MGDAGVYVGIKDMSTTAYVPLALLNYPTAEGAVGMNMATLDQIEEKLQKIYRENPNVVREKVREDTVRQERANHWTFEGGQTEYTTILY